MTPASRFKLVRSTTLVIVLGKKVEVELGKASFDNTKTETVIDALD